MENTETIQNNPKWEGNFADFLKENSDKVTVEAPVFIIFAEYLGYVSRFIKLAEDWCDGKIPEPYIQKIMMMESKTIFRQMQKDYTLEEIKGWYNTYLPVILNEFIEKLSKATIPVDIEDI